MKKNIFLTACAALGIWSCSKDNSGFETDTTINVSVNVVSDLRTRASASDDENKVNAFDLFVFDQASGLLESVQMDIKASEPSMGDKAGEQNIGRVSVELKDGKTKNVLALANRSDNAVSMPAVQVGETRYTDMLAAVTTLQQDNRALASPFIMAGYANDIKAGEQSALSISLRRRVAKLSVTNLSAEEGLTVSSVQLKQAIDQAYLFQQGHPATEIKYVDHEPVSVESDASPVELYVFPQSADENRLSLTVQGTLNGNPFTQDLAVKPVVDGEVQDMEHNAVYSVKLNAEAQSVSMQVSLQQENDWTDGGDISGTITPEAEKTILFNGLQWMDRNLGAISADLENDWDNAIGKFYQWGRNAAFGTSDIPTLSGPVTADVANEPDNLDKFITRMNKDWLDGTDNTRWQDIESQPCPDGYRMPTVTDFMGIFTSPSVIVNMVTGPVEKTENLAGGSFTAQYWGDRDRSVYGIKKLGTADAYFIKWTYMTTSGENAFVRICRWKAGTDATFTGKELADIQEEFTALGLAEETIDFPAAGNITGSSGTYSAGSPGGYYWSSSLNGDGVHRAEFTSGKMIAGDTYNSRVSGHSVRCIKQE